MGKLDDYIVSTHLEPQEKVLQQLFETNSAFTIFEIGACEGENSVRYAKRFPNVRLFAFEPLPGNYENLCARVAQYACHQVQPVPLCLSEAVGEADFFVSSGRPQGATDPDWDFGNKSSSLLPPDRNAEFFPWMEFKQKISVKTSTIDIFCKEKNIKKVDFMHIDVQGAELMVLNGGKKALANTSALWIEVSQVSLYKGQALKRDVEQTMQQLGFVKIMDTVGGWSGDQFWVKRPFFVARQGLLALWKAQWQITKADTTLWAKQKRAHWWRILAKVKQILLGRRA